MARRNPAKKEVQEPVQNLTLTSIARLMNITGQDALLLGMLGYAATKVYNVANHYRRSTWKDTGFVCNCQSAAIKRILHPILGDLLMSDKFEVNRQGLDSDVVELAR